MPRPKQPRHFFGNSLLLDHDVRFSIAAKTRLTTRLMPQQCLISAAQTALRRQNVASVSRVVRKMAHTIESI
jgi:hypothetical protein